MNVAEPEDDFVREIGRQADRRHQANRPGVWQGLAQVGTIGWMVSLPAVGGGFLGNWLDDRYQTGVFWTLGLLTSGLTIGCVSAWRAMKRELGE